MNRNNRRHFLHQLAAGGILLTPLAGALSGCSQSDWPEGMHPIVWDRDQCTRCSMVISDPRFAAEIRGGTDNTAFKFDDIGCLIFWLQDQASTYPWMIEADTRMWVADFNNQHEPFRWITPDRAHFVSKTSPMGYNFGAFSTPQEGSIDFDNMRKRILSTRGK